MNLQDLKEMVECRENIVGFLHISDIMSLKDQGIDVDGLSFEAAAAVVFDLREKKTISKNVAQEAIQLMCANNSRIKTERFRFDPAYNTIYEYCESGNSYKFYRKGSKKDFNALISTHGKYI